MKQTDLPKLSSQRFEIDPDHLGQLTDSSPQRDNLPLLRERIQRDGYLYLRGLLDRDQVLAARREVATRLKDNGLLLPGSDPMDCIADPNYRGSFKPEFALDNKPLMKLLYDGEMMKFFEGFLAAPVRHYDYTWLRVVAPGEGTRSHCDVVYMGRGTTTSLHSAWTPLGDIDYVTGGLMVLSGSNNNQRLKDTYGKYDVDTFCENRPHIKGWKHGGTLGSDPNQIRRSLGGTWLTAEFRAGDVLIFTPFTVHASLDNRSNTIRLSSDTRYQRADEPADERWVGENPIGHSSAGQRGRVC